ncbi:MAG: chromosome segregation protein SMC [Candidatus Marsarchaeota archaeon]|nr:chromosome segregation protein SMC [Candidatus Marsarchaeota archaeon]
MAVYLEELILHNFKSFKRADIKFDKGFTCVVGPNGSGKSNICDALLFVLGESSLKRMRAQSVIQLFNNSADANTKKSLPSKAYVKAKFKLDKGELEIARIIKSNGKVAYRLNDKRVTKQELVEALSSIKSNINETNTITQGEITYLLNLSAKERRSLIDTAAGIKEFDDKKNISLKELEKVEQKINEAKIILNEKFGFLEELEKEKKDAEYYIELTTLIKKASYTLLKLRENEVENKYNEALNSFDKINSTVKELENKIKKIDESITLKSEERNKYSNLLNKKNTELGSLNKTIEELNKNFAVYSTQKESLKSNLLSINKRISDDKNSLNSIITKIKENKLIIETLNIELESKIQMLPKEKQNISEIADKYSTLNSSINELMEKLKSVELEIIKYDSHIENLTNEIKEALSRNDMFESDHNEVLQKINETKVKIEENLKDINTAKDEISKINKDINQLKEQQGKLMRDELILREELARDSRSNKVVDLLKMHSMKGVYGRVLDLCIYNEKYGRAIYAAGGARMNYIVVDKIETANSAIKYLRDNNLRASFIPLEDIKIQSINTKSNVNLDYVIKHVEYDKKFSKVFEYVFGDTSIISNLLASKGNIGSRYVTIEGDLIESNGIITGGVLKVSNISEAKMKNVKNELEDVNNKIMDLENATDSIKAEIAEYEKTKLGNEILLRTLIDNEKRIASEIASVSSTVKNKEASVVQSKDKRAKIIEEAMKLKESLKTLNDEFNIIKGLFENASKKGRKENEEIEKQLRSSIEKIKIDSASIKKENEMLMSKEKEVETQIDAMSTEIASSEHEIIKIDSLINDINKQREELKSKLEGHDKVSSEIYKKISLLDDEIAKLSEEKGKLTSNRMSFERNYIETESKISQYKTRLGDIKAELIGYENVEMIEEKDIYKIDSQITDAKNKLNKLGNINLKAPEVYSEKKRETDEAMEKMKTLQLEKDSIINMINQIESKKYDVFMETFEVVNKNFMQLYKYVFDGEARLVLQNPKDIFNSALLIDATLRNQRQNTEQFSGGQKTLLVLMIILALQIRNAMSLYIFDEIDVSLDKENAKKLSKLIKELSKSSQFIVVSHNDVLITSADTAIGVMIRNNESHSVGVRVADINEVKESTEQVQA